MSYDWVESNIYEAIPSNAVWCCKNKEGLDVYFGKYSFENSELGVQILPQKKEAFAAYNGKEIPAINYRVLINIQNEYHIWMRILDGNIPSNTIQCGHDKKNNSLLVGRAFHKGYLIPGYVHTLTKVIHISYEGKEYKYAEYEVLIITKV